MHICVQRTECLSSVFAVQHIDSVLKGSLIRPLNWVNIIVLKRTECLSSVLFYTHPDSIV